MLADLRKDYTLAGLSEGDVAADPIEQFRVWFEQAQAAMGHEPNAMTVCTASKDGVPSARTILLKGLDHGFIFYSNHQSPKGRDLAENPRAELLFYWPEVERQVRIAGHVEHVSREQTEAYFRSRPRGNQIGASVSPQGQVIESREALDEQYAAFEASVGDGDIPVPDHWGGFRVIPESMEFWQGRRSRLHDRLKYLRQDNGSWKLVRLAP